ncbi:TAFII28-domain-containing protein [Hygrophoropsis aurantiaca]|uniref:TAFII28-domain-containing protein n=1 Tax=Hygrophoropsis aurantiaca TaxID=72124 RepID=A0ACB8ADH5_9AGAM|nr:TAFII28-domain-containing protein [Hygrophoropsis aurantiaca]
MNTPTSTPITPRGRGTGAKRGRKPRGAFPNVAIDHTPRTPTPQQTGSSVSATATQFTPLQWTSPGTPTTDDIHSPSQTQLQQETQLHPQNQTISLGGSSSNTNTIVLPQPDGSTGTGTNIGGLNAGVSGAAGAPGTPRPGEEDGEGEDELLPAMADDDYSAQLSWQSESKDNLKVLMDNFSPAQYDRFEAYRRHALPKQAVRKVIQQTTGQQVSQPVAQIVAGFAKVFVGEIVEKARAVQARRNETGPLSPDHLREAYRLYQSETGRVGSARPARGRRIFVR